MGYGETHNGGTEKRTSGEGETHKEGGDGETHKEGGDREMHNFRDRQTHRGSYIEMVPT